MGFVLFLAVAASVFAQSENSTSAAPPTYGALTDSLEERARKEVERVRELVAQGTLPQSQLTEAERRLADARDEVTLAHTLYGQTRVEDTTPEQAHAMLEAAQRRVDRERPVVEERRKLLEMGIISRTEMESLAGELESRQRVLDLAKNRVRLLDDLRKMAEHERELQQAATLKQTMIRFEGKGLFSLNDLTSISGQFEKKFGHPLPVSALGQTLVHQAMGLDHRNRADIALSPDQPEGLWLRRLLEKLKVPYLGFRAAMAGAATAPHIHIGPGSMRLHAAGS